MSDQLVPASQPGAPELREIVERLKELSDQVDTWGRTLRLWEQTTLGFVVLAYVLVGILLLR